MVCKNICETFPSTGPGGYLTGVRFCSKCSKFIRYEGVFCLCCGSNLHTGPYDKKERQKRNCPKNGT